MLIDGSGFTESSPIEASTVTNEQTPWTYWHNNGFEEPLTDTWIAFDLGALSELDSMVVWNFNVDIPGEDLTPMGIKDFDLRLSANSEFGDGDDIVLAGLALNEASGLSSESGQVIALGGVSGIRYVQIKVLTNHSYEGFFLPEFVGLSEVRFTGARLDLYAPVPLDEAVTVPLETDLEWSSDMATGFEVYFSTDPNALTLLANTSESMIPNSTLPILEYETTYYWQVVGQVAGEPDQIGPVWSFTTTPATTLVLHWGLDEGSGTTALDSSGNSNNGLLINEPNYVPGILGTALEFVQHANEEVRLSDANSLPVLGTDNYTMNFFVWVPQQPANFTHIAGFGSPWEGLADGESRSIIRHGDSIFDMGYGYDIDTDVDFNENRWQMITSVYDGYLRQKSIYKNGKLIGEISAELTDASNEVALSAVTEGWNNLAGRIDDFKIWHGNFSEDEIQDLLPFAHNPYPVDESDEIGLDVMLMWDAGNSSIAHNLYYSTQYDDVNEILVDPIVITNLPEPGYELLGLDIETTYYWQVDEVTASGIIEAAEIWSFTTAPPRAYSPTPQDGATEVPLGQQLSWLSAGSGPYTYNVYFGTDPQDLALVSSNQSDATFNPSALEYNESYYWKIEQLDNGVPTAEGVVWSFTTIVPVCDPPLLGDLTGDCYVSIEDLALLASDWLTCNLQPQDACP